MWPLLRPGRGSGARPSKRSAGRASTTCAEPSPAPPSRRRSRRQSMVEPRGERSRGAGGSPVRAAVLRAAIGQAALEDRHVLDAEGAQRPPRAPRRTGPGRRRRRSACRRRGRAPSSPARKFRVGQHVRQAARRIGDDVDVEEHRAGNVPCAKFAAPLRPVGGRCQEASITPRSGSPRCAASHSVETKLRERMAWPSARNSMCIFPLVLQIKRARESQSLDSNQISANAQAATLEGFVREAVSHQRRSFDQDSSLLRSAVFHRGRRAPLTTRP